MSKTTKPAIDQLRDAIADAERRGVTRYAMDKATGIHRSTITRIVEHGTTPGLDVAAKLADAAGYELRITRKK